MSGPGLNLKAVRKRIQTLQQAPEPAAEPLSSRPLSRRDLLKLAGAVTAVAVAPVWTGAEEMTLGAAQLVAAPGRAAFLLGGRERWVIDTGRFGGRPHLQVERSDGAIRLLLTGAAYPGTEIPAGFTCTLNAARTGWRMHLQMEFGGLDCEVRLERWLTGLEPARSQVRIAGPATPLGAAGFLALSGRGRAEFSPDWTLKVDGRAVAVVGGMTAAPLMADTAIIRLQGAGEESILASPPARRTRVTLERGARQWSLGPRFPLPAGWTLSGEPFGVIHLEAGVNSRGAVRRALIAEPGPGVVALRLQAGPDVALSLANPRYAVAFDHDQRALYARYGPEPAWLQTGGVSLLVGDGPGIGPLELISRGEALQRISVAPALLAVNAPLEGVITETTWNPEGTRLIMAAGGDEQSPTYQVNPNPNYDASLIDNPQMIAQPILILPTRLIVTVIRPADLLVLRFEFVNLTLKSGDGKPARLQRKAGPSPAYIIVHFQPQHIAEQAFFEAIKPADSEAPTEPPVQARMAGPSRLVFRLPPTVAEIPYTLEDLLSWVKHEQSVAPVALLPPLNLKEITGDEEDCACAPVTPGLRWPPPVVKAPEEHHTAIEAPYRVILSTNKYAAWAHAPAPITHEGWTELWHTRLGVRAKAGGVDELSPANRTVRAIWSPDFTTADPPPTSDTSPFRMSLKSRNRNEIVHLSSDFTLSGFTPSPIRVDRLMLSALGAWMNVHGAWEPPGNYNLEEWRHRAVMARDSYVRVVEKGYLFPLGHRASLITITERKFQPTPGGKTAAYLRQREYIVVRQFEKTYPGTGMSYEGRAFPFRKVTLGTLVTPDLDPAQNIAGTPAGSCRWVRAGGADFLFHCAGEDRDGTPIEFTTPLVFVLNAIANDGAALDNVAKDLRTGTAVTRRQRPINGQKLAYAPSDKPGDTAFETQTFTFDAEVPDSAVTLPANQPRFYPIMGGAAVRMAAVEQVTGSSAGAGIKYHQTYLEKGFDASANKAAIFAALDSPVQMKWNADQAGGIATPNLDIGGLSRKLGPVGGSPDDLLGAQFDPAKFFNNQAKILGGILLTDILDTFGLDELGGDGKKAPRLTNRVIYPKVGGKEDTAQPPEALETRFQWEPKVKSDPLKVFEPTAGKTRMKIDAKLLTRFAAPPSSTYEILGELKEFKVNLLGDGPAKFLVLTFKQLVFTAKTGAKPGVNPEITKVEFAGPLAFVNKLKDYLKSSGSGPSIDVLPAGVNVSFSLAIPSVQVGVLSIQNIKFTSQLSLPFNGDPVRLRFAFCERESPFLLTVSMFGGGGFFGIALGLDGIEMLEASLEFGGQLALNLGVASGGVYVMAGIYYKMENDECTLTGYLKMGGSLEVLGIITVSAEFYMALTYQSPGKVYGQASLTVKVEVLFFSASVSISVEKRFKGDEADPTFADLIDKPHWDEYCEAFA